MSIRIERNDSPLGRWLIAHHDPPGLAGLVGGIWYFEGCLGPLRERHFPHGRLHMVVHLGPCYSRVEGDRVEPFSRTCLSGLFLGPDVIEAPPGPTRLLGVQLYPAGAFALLARPLHELTGLTVDLEDVVAASASELADRCAAGRSPQECLRTAAAWIGERVRRHEGAEPAIAWMAGEIERRAGAVSIARLRDRTGWSKSRLATRFREQIGVPPKTLARIVRFRTAIERVGGTDDAMAEVALAAGYYDQPHFNAEFRELSGFTPGEYRARHRYPNSTSLPESA